MDKRGGNRFVASAPRYLSLKRAAQRLGIHEQTLRSWERQGVIHLARLPKSGYRRVPIEEVERIENEMNSERSATITRLVFPQTDAESLWEAQFLAEAICDALAELDSVHTFDDLMRTRRGRTWSP